MNYEEAQRRLLADPEVREAFDNPPFALALAQTVIEWRRSVGMSQKELASHLGTSQNQVWRIESGDANVTVNTLQKLADLCGFQFSVISPSTSYRYNSNSSERGVVQIATTKDYTGEAIEEQIVYGPEEEVTQRSSNALGVKAETGIRQ